MEQIQEGKVKKTRGRHREGGPGEGEGEGGELEEKIGMLEAAMNSQVSVSVSASLTKTIGRQSGTDEI